MSVNDRLAALRERHSELEGDIRVAYENFADDWTVNNLKKQKLRIRDKIDELESQLDSEPPTLLQ